jgi:hypothetical protein
MKNQKTVIIGFVLLVSLVAVHAQGNQRNNQNNAATTQNNTEPRQLKKGSNLTISPTLKGRVDKASVIKKGTPSTGSITVVITNSDTKQRAEYQPSQSTFWQQVGTQFVEVGQPTGFSVNNEKEITPLGRTLIIEAGGSMTFVLYYELTPKKTSRRTSPAPAPADITINTLLFDFTGTLTNVSRLD